LQEMLAQTLVDSSIAWIFCFAVIEGMDVVMKVSVLSAKNLMPTQIWLVLSTIKNVISCWLL
jgi:hypothetical protein